VEIKWHSIVLVISCVCKIFHKLLKLYGAAKYITLKLRSCWLKVALICEKDCNWWRVQTGALVRNTLWKFTSCFDSGVYAYRLLRIGNNSENRRNVRTGFWSCDLSVPTGQHIMKPAAHLSYHLHENSGTLTIKIKHLQSIIQGQWPCTFTKYLLCYCNKNKLKLGLTVFCLGWTFSWPSVYRPSYLISLQKDIFLDCWTEHLVLS
jgi:hypothetical protein